MFSVVDVLPAVPFASPWAPNPSLCTGCCRAQPVLGALRVLGFLAGWLGLDKEPPFAGGRELARQWKGKLGHILGLKSLDDVLFILGFS